MHSKIRRATWTCALLLAVPALLLPAARTDVSAAAGPGVQTPNYELASQWTTAKIDKAVFDLGVTPHWLETSDRFWYAYETRDGKRHWLVDPAKKSRAPLFDNAKLAAMLTAATLVPMDAQHLPIKTLKAIKSDTTLRLEVEVPKDAEIPGMKATPPVKTNTAGDKQGDDDALGVDPQQRRGGAAGDDEENSDKKSVVFEYDLASAKLTLLPDFKDPKKPRWASVSPDDATIVFARGHNLFMMDAAGYAKARVTPGDASVAE